MAYRILDHTADVGIEATAPDLPGLFSEAVRGMAAVILAADPPPPAAREPVAAEADDLAALLVAVLDEALFRFETTGRLPVGAELEVSDRRAEGSFGLVTPRAPDGPQIKAVTYHQLEVARGPEGWRARVFFDV
jgi:SHS2 domain-containing protein